MIEDELEKRRGIEEKEKVLVKGKRKKDIEKLYRKKKMRKIKINEKIENKIIKK